MFGTQGPDLPSEERPRGAIVKFPTRNKRP